MAGVLLGLLLLLAVLAIAGAVATAAGRRAAGSERAQDVLADEQAALRRVATLVAGQPSPPEVFAAVTEETARTVRLLHIDSAHLVVYERDKTATVVASWNLHGRRSRSAYGYPWTGTTSSAACFARNSRPASTITPRPEARWPTGSAPLGFARRPGFRSWSGGQLWGVMAVGSSRPEPLPADTETRIGAFTELVGTAIANAAARAELEQVAAEQAALGRVATLVAEAAPPSEVYTAVAAEVAGVFGVPLVGVYRYEREGDATVIAGAGNFSAYLGRSWPCPPGDPGLVASLQRTGQPLRIDDCSGLSRSR